MSLIYTADSDITGGKRHSLYIGARSDAKDRDKLRRWGVSHILNVTAAKDAGVKSGVPNFFEKDRSFVYKRIPVYDASTSASDLLGYADDIVNFISRGLCHGAVLVHCNMGQSRSTTAALFFLLRKANLSLEDGLKMVKRRRPTAEPIPAFGEILKQYETICGQKRQQEGSNIATNSVEPSGRKRAGRADNMGTEKRGRVGPAMGPGNTIGPARGPTAGPTIGPSMPPKKSTEDDNATDAETQTKKSIGPARGPTAGRTIGPSMPPKSTDDSSTVATKASIGPARGPAAGPTIGPSMPPKSTDDSTTVSTKASIGPARGPAAGPTIGPSMPPSS